MKEISAAMVRYLISASDDGLIVNVVKREAGFHAVVKLYLVIYTPKYSGYCTTVLYVLVKLEQLLYLWALVYATYDIL